MNKSILIIKRFCFFFIIPFTELVFLRFVISKEAIYEYLFLLFSPGKIFYALIPLVIFFVVFMLLLDKKSSSLPLSFQKGSAVINVLFLGMFLFASLNLAPLNFFLGKKWLYEANCIQTTSQL